MLPDDRAKEYARIRRWLWLAELVLSLGLLAAALGTGWAKQWADAVEKRWSPWPIQVALYAGSLSGLMTLALFPLSWFSGFWLEHRFGLTTQKFSGWLNDQLKGLAVGSVLALPVVVGLAALLRGSPDTWWIWAALLWVIWSTVLTRVAPSWIIPIFYRQRPLQDGPLKRRLEELLRQSATRVHGIFEVNLSRTTRKANACLCGMGRSRRVLISDTLLAHHPPEEVEVVLAHELGHHRHHHLGLLILASSVATGLSCWLVDQGARSMFAPLGLRGLDDLGMLPLAALGLSLVQLLSGPVLHALSRRLEAQADRYALKKTNQPAAFVAAMKRLAEENLAEADPPRWVEWFFYDHPPIAKRIAMARQWEG